MRSIIFVQMMNCAGRTCTGTTSNCSVRLIISRREKNNKNKWEYATELQSHRATEPQSHGVHIKHYHVGNNEKTQRNQIEETWKSCRLLPHGLEFPFGGHASMHPCVRLEFIQWFNEQCRGHLFFSSLPIFPFSLSSDINNIFHLSHISQQNIFVSCGRTAQKKYSNNESGDRGRHNKFN